MVFVANYLINIGYGAVWCYLSLIDVAVVVALILSYFMFLLSFLAEETYLLSKEKLPTALGSIHLMFGKQ
ncbi:MAG: presenilin-like A22 family membrane protease [Bacillariaceae sp.]|jgi:presenilin-like A22 family membrane protease